MVAVLIVNGEPVYHTDDNRIVLYEYLMENYGPFTDIEGWSGYWGEGAISNASDLGSCFNVDSGLETCSYKLRDGEGNLIDIVVIIAPWYLYSINDPEVKEAVRNYYLDLGINPDEQ